MGCLYLQRTSSDNTKNPENTTANEKKEMDGEDRPVRPALNSAHLSSSDWALCNPLKV